jgi:hypothetical protein
MVRKALMLFSLLFTVTASTLVNAQSRNLLQNADAAKGTESWSTYGEAVVEKKANYSCFVVRPGGHFWQDVELPKNAAGQYLVFIGRGAGERLSPKDGTAGTSAPYLYGYMMQPPPPGGKEILAYLQGQQMRAEIDATNEWVNMWGIFEVPDGTTKVRFFLMQSSTAKVPHDGSAARFASLGLFMFSRKEDAEVFVRHY